MTLTHRIEALPKGLSLGWKSPGRRDLVDLTKKGTSIARGSGRFFVIGLVDTTPGI